MIMKKPQKKDHCSVEVSFDAGGRQYSVKRVVGKGSGSIASAKQDCRRGLKADLFKGRTGRLKELGCTG